MKHTFKGRDGDFGEFDRSDESGFLRFVVPGIKQYYLFICKEWIKANGFSPSAAYLTVSKTPFKGSLRVKNINDWHFVSTKKSERTSSLCQSSALRYYFPTSKVIYISIHD